MIGIVKDGENQTAMLLTDQDVWLPFIPPMAERLVDTRTAVGRQRIALPSPLLSDGRVPAGAEIIIGIAPTGAGFGIPAVFLNLTVVSPKSGGHAVAYPGPIRPPTSTVNFTKARPWRMAR